MDNLTRKNLEMAYIADEECFGQMLENRKLVYEFNTTKPWDTEALEKAVRRILGKAGENITVIPPFYCDYGKNIEIGDNFFSNYNLTILDVASVRIGNNVFLAPNVSIYTAGHPVHYEPRNAMYEYGISVTIGDNCWIGGNVTVCPGVHIGDGAVIGAGSVVTKDVPPMVIAAGNPCRVIREITDADKEFYFKDRKFDEEAARDIKEKLSK